MLKAIIVDDEPHSAESLKILIRDFCEDVEVMALASNGAEALRAIDQYDPDVLFLDINLQHESGFDVLARMRKIRCSIIFTTAYAEFAIKAFRFSAVDYLLKPIDTNDLRESIAKAKKYKDTDTKSKVEQLLHHLQSSQHKPYNKLAIPSVNGLTFVDQEDIMYCEAKSNYTRIHLADGTKQMTSRTLKQVEGQLMSENFFRIHHSYVINLKYLERYDKGQGLVHLGNKIQLDVSKRRKEEFLNKIMGPQKKEADNSEFLGDQHSAANSLRAR